MINRAIASVLAALTALLFVAAPASADIKAYNAAVAAGDYKKAAAEAKAVWAGWDRKRADTALIAREFGYISYVAGDYTAARDYGQFLKNNGKFLSTPDDQPATSAVLLAIASFRLKSDEVERVQLLDALRLRQAAPGIDRQTVLAAEALYTSDWRSGDYHNTADSAGIAADLLSRGGKPLVVRSLQARSFNAIANFMAKPDRDDFFLVADAHDAVVDALDVSPNEEERAELLDLKFTLQAWADSIDAYFSSSFRLEANVLRRLKARVLKSPAHPLFPESTPDDVRCLMDFHGGGIKYPTSAAYRKLVGAVILRVDVDHEGRITNPRVLASVPSPEFGNELLKTIGTARYSRHADAKPGCLLFSPSHILKIKFQID